jgi:hypothetical protein
MLLLYWLEFQAIDPSSTVCMHDLLLSGHRKVDDVRYLGFVTA